MTKLGLWPVDAGWQGAVWAPSAAAVDLLLLSETGDELKRLPCTLGAEAVWQVTLANAPDSLHYGWSVDGGPPLIDPYARAFEGVLIHGDGLGVSPKAQPISCTSRDLFAPAPQWTRPATAWANSVIYECHLKGYSQLREDILPCDRGRLSAWHDGKLAAELRTQGFTAVEFLPLHAFADERHLPPLGLSNYWGYNSYGFFAPEPRYGTANDVIKMVQACHSANLEVIVDVVYNHTAEGDHDGPCFAFKGLGNDHYYRIEANTPNRYQNPTGTGNSLDTGRTEVQALVLDSLDYWHNHLGVDGFRFDLAPTLARNSDGWMGHSDLLEKIAADPRLSTAKLIAEPWDIGPDGYQLGGEIFSARWHQWNDRTRDDARRLLAEPQGALRAYVPHLVGDNNQVGFITAHDGFSLHDMVSYLERHNHANGENNRDGHGHNLSVNFGVEGPTDDPAIHQQRQAAMAFFLTLMAVSRPVPMFSMGDEIARTQQGNNNAYCQDNALSWMSWQPQPGYDFRSHVTKALDARARWLGDFLTTEITPENTRWFDAGGAPMTAQAWENPDLRALSMLFEDQLAISISLDGQPATLSGAGWQQRLSSCEQVRDRPLPYVCLATRSR